MGNNESPHLVGKTPPHHNESERAALGAMMLSEDCQHDILALLNEDDFYSRAHRKIFKAIKELSSREKEVDCVIVGNYLAEKKELSECGDSHYLSSLTQEVPTLANARYYAENVLAKSQLRKLLDLTMEVQESIFQEGDTHEAYNLAESQLISLSEQRIKNNTDSIEGLMETVMLDFNNRLVGEDGTKGISCHYHALMKYLIGFRAGEMIVVAARPSMGKTSFALNLILDMAVHQNIPVAFFSLEMPALQIANNMVCIEASVNGNYWRNPTEPIREDEAQNLDNAIERISNSTIIIDDDAEMTETKLRSKLRRLKREKGIQIAFIDYLQLMTEPRMQREGRTAEMAHISRKIKSISKEINIPVVALAQLNRAVETRTGNVPKMADLRESGSIEQDADAIILLHRPDYYNTDERPGEVDVILAKHRNGATGTIPLSFVKEMMRFENLSRE